MVSRAMPLVAAVEAGGFSAASRKVRTLSGYHGATPPRSSHLKGCNRWKLKTCVQIP
jgi:hypothetical protein